MQGGWSLVQSHSTQMQTHSQWLLEVLRETSQVMEQVQQNPQYIVCLLAGLLWFAPRSGVCG